MEIRLGQREAFVPKEYDKRWHEIIHSVLRLHNKPYKDLFCLDAGHEKTFKFYGSVTSTAGMDHLKAALVDDCVLHRSWRFIVSSPQLAEKTSKPSSFMQLHLMVARLNGSNASHLIYSRLAPLPSRKSSKSHVQISILLAHNSPRKRFTLLVHCYF